MPTVRLTMPAVRRMYESVSCLLTFACTPFPPLPALATSVPNFGKAYRLITNWRRATTWSASMRGAPLAELNSKFTTSSSPGYFSRKEAMALFNPGQEMALRACGCMPLTSTEKTAESAFAPRRMRTTRSARSSVDLKKRSLYTWNAPSSMPLSSAQMSW